MQGSGGVGKRMRKNNARRARGFTLVELIAVIAIITIISGSVMVSYVQLDRRSLDGEVQKFLSDFYLARKLTVNTRERHNITFSNDGKGYVLENGSNVIVRRSGLRSQADSDPLDIVLSPPRGNVSSGPDKVVFSLGGRQKNITVNKDSGTLDLQ